MKIKTTTLEYFEISEVEKPGAETVSLLLTADCFTENTPKSTAIELIYCDLLMSGAGEFSRGDFQYKVNELGANISVTHSEGRMTVSISTLSNKLKPTLKLLELMLLRPSFKVSEQKRAVSALKNSIELYKEDARSLAHSALKNSFFNRDSRHFSYSPDEVSKALETVTNAELKAFHKYFINSYWTVGVGGNDKSVIEVQTSIKKLKKSGTPKSSEPNTGTLAASRKTLLHEVKSKQNIEISIGNYLPLTLLSDDLPAFLFGLSVLGKWGGFSGRLMSTVRAEEGLTYTIYARAEGLTAAETGLWRIFTFFAPKDVKQGIASTIREIEKIERTGITESELQRFKTILKTGDSLVFDSLGGTVSLAHNKLVSGIHFADHQKFREKLYTCTRSEVNAALKKYLSPKTLVISAAGPIANVKADLESFAK
jgi:zinc protease